jgi:hypothetical protein
MALVARELPVAAAQPAVAAGRTPRSLRSLVRPALNGSIVGRTGWTLHLRR